MYFFPAAIKKDTKAHKPTQYKEIVSKEIHSHHARH